MAKRYDTATVKKIREGLGEAPTHASPEGITTRELVRALADEIRELLEQRGYTVAALARYLGDLGAPVSVPTLAQYLRDEGVRSGLARGTRAPAARKKRTSSGGRRGPATGSSESAPGPPGGSEGAAVRAESGQLGPDAVAAARAHLASRQASEVASEADAGVRAESGQLGPDAVAAARAHLASRQASEVASDADAGVRAEKVSRGAAATSTRG